MLYSEVEPLIMGRTWEQMPVGWSYRTSYRTVTETDLVNFITLGCFNEPLFWDTRHSVEGSYQSRLVPGALTFTIAEGLVVQSGAFHGTGLAFLHMELDIRAPVYVGDTVGVVVEITEARPTSTPGRGLVTSRNTIFNHDDQVVAVYTPLRLVRGQDFEPHA